MDRLSKIGHRLATDQRGITGLETAIVLIAFVVVASVFAFTVLTTGIFTSQEARDASEAAITSGESTLKRVGPFVGGGTCLNNPCSGMNGPIDWSGCPRSNANPPITFDDGSPACGAHAQLIRFRLTPSEDERISFNPAETTITWFDKRPTEANRTQIIPHRGCVNAANPCNPTPIGPTEANLQGSCMGASLWCYRFQPGQTDQILEPGEYVEIFIGGMGGVIHPLEKNTEVMIHVIPRDGAVVRVVGIVPGTMEQVMSFLP